MTIPRPIRRPAASLGMACAIRRMPAASLCMACVTLLAACGTERSVNVEGDSNDRFATVSGGQRQNYWGIGGEQAELLGTNLADRSDEDPTVTDPDFPAMGNMPGFGPNW